MFIQRLTPCDHSIKLTYRIKLIAGSYTWDSYQERRAISPNDSNIYEINYTDVNGLCRPYRFDRVRELMQTEGKFTVSIELKDAVSKYLFLFAHFHQIYEQIKRLNLFNSSDILFSSRKSKFDLVLRRSF